MLLVKSFLLFSSKAWYCRNKVLNSCSICRSWLFNRRFGIEFQARKRVDSLVFDINSRVVSFYWLWIPFICVHLRLKTRKLIHFLVRNQLFVSRSTSSFSLRTQRIWFMCFKLFYLFVILFIGRLILSTFVGFLKKALIAIEACHFEFLKS